MDKKYTWSLNELYGFQTMQRNDNLPTSDTNRTDRLILVIKCLDDVLVPSGDV